MIKSSNVFSNSRYKLSEKELMDKIAVTVINCLHDKHSFSFKGGWVLSKIYPNDFRRTCDVDMSIINKSIFDDLKVKLEELCENLISIGEIHNYKITEPNPDRKRSGGVKMFRLTPNGIRYKASGLDVSVKDLSKGVSLLKIGIPIFTFERMMSDKLKVLFSSSCVRRVKDVFDGRLLIDRVELDVDDLKELCKLSCVNFLNNPNVFSNDLHEDLLLSWEDFLVKDEIRFYKNLDDNLLVIKEWLKEVDLIV